MYETFDVLHLRHVYVLVLSYKLWKNTKISQAANKHEGVLRRSKPYLISATLGLMFAHISWNYNL